MQDFFEWKMDKDKESIINDILELKMKKPQTDEIKLAIQKLQQKGIAEEILLEYEHIRELIDLDVSFLEGYYPPAIKLIPEKYRNITENLLSEFAEKMRKIEKFETFKI